LKPCLYTNDKTSSSAVGLANLVRSVVGIGDVLEVQATLKMLTARLDKLQRELATRSVESPLVPVTKMEAVTALSLESTSSYADLTCEPPPVVTPAVHGGGQFDIFPGMVLRRRCLGGERLVAARRPGVSASA
jgi:hypothetical protein